MVWYNQHTTSIISKRYKKVNKKRKKEIQVSKILKKLLGGARASGASHVRGCLLDTGATFAPEWVHSCSLSWLYICLNDTTTKCHAGTSRPVVSSPRLLYRGENFTPVRNLTTVSCKREMTTRFGVKSVCRVTGTGSSCVMFVILNLTCILSTWSVPSNNEIWNDPVISVWNSRRYEFSHVNTP